MIQEDKELLTKDLCARLPYGVLCVVHDDEINEPVELLSINPKRDKPLEIDDGYSENSSTYWSLEDATPYLRPLSSMMQGEWEEMTALIYPYGRVNLNNKNELLLWLSVEGNDMPIILMDNVFSWLNEHNFDYRGLIEKGLALEAPEGMYK